MSPSWPGMERRACCSIKMRASCVLGVHQIESLGKGCHRRVILSMLARKQANVKRFCAAPQPFEVLLGQSSATHSTLPGIPEKAIHGDRPTRSNMIPGGSRESRRPPQAEWGDFCPPIPPGGAEYMRPCSGKLRRPSCKLASKGSPACAEHQSSRKALR